MSEAKRIIAMPCQKLAQLIGQAIAAGAGSAVASLERQSLHFSKPFGARYN
jgi:hypothetical protein